MQITAIQAHPISFRVPEGQNVRLGIGRSVKRDAVLVKVSTDEGITGWGEAHHGRAPGAIARLVEDGAVSFVQPDLSKAGGMTECLRIAALASAWKLSFNPHTSATSINMAASIHALCAVDNAGFFEGDVTTYNPFRDQMGSAPYALDADGCVRPLEMPGIGVEVDEDFINAHPLIDGPCYV